MKVARRLSHITTARAWCKWSESVWYVRVRKRVERSSLRCVKQLLTRAFISWEQHVQGAKRIRKAAAKARLKTCKLAASLNLWVNQIRACRKHLHATKKVVLRLQQMAMVAAMSRWMEHTSEVKRLRRSASKVVRRMQHVLLYCCISAWGFSVSLRRG